MKRKSIKQYILLVLITTSSTMYSQNYFKYNNLADVLLRYEPRGTGGRAIVHDSGNVLTLNYGSDFTGGTKVYGKLNVLGNLRVGNKIEAQEIKVSTTPTADFVFEEGYNIPSLDFVENYIKENKHLPEIASSQEMKHDGVNIGDFQIKLLQKIEELTLYTIQQQKQIEVVLKENQQLRKEIDELKKP